MASESEALKDLKVDKENLYLEETFTDLRVGSLRRLTPMTPAGVADRSRPTLYMGQTQVLSQMGPLPIQFAIDAESLDEALDRFPVAAEEAVQRMVEEVKELQRQQASQIVVPGSGAAVGSMPPMTPSGRIQLR